MAAFSMCDLATNQVASSDAFNRNELLRRQALTDGGVREFDHNWASRRVLRVLVVDDDEDTTDGLVWLVRHWGHAGRMAYDGGVALQVAADQRPDVVLLDVQMPVMDGYEVARKLRRDFPSTECIIVAVTGDADERGRRQCLEAGIDVVLIKPVLSSVVETLLMQEHERVNRLSPDTMALRALNSVWLGDTKLQTPCDKEIRDAGSF